MMVIRLRTIRWWRMRELNSWENKKNR